jgi:hypothetical protein
MPFQILLSLVEGAVSSAIALGGFAQAPPAEEGAEAQQMLEAMAATTNASPPPGVRGATAAPNMLILHVVSPPGAATSQFADAFQRQSIEFICRDAGMRRLADQHGATFRISVERGGRAAPVIHDIASASCASIPAAIVAVTNEPRPAEAAGGLPAPARVALSGDQLEAMARRARAFVPRDRFDVPPALPSVNGSRFSYIVTPLPTGPDNSICQGSPSWGYWPQDGRLEVSAGQGVGIASDYRASDRPMFGGHEGQIATATLVSFSSFRCQKTRLPGYRATNGFGVPFEVGRTTEVVTAIGEFSRPATSWRTYWTTQISGDPARQLAQNLQVRVSGTLSDWAPGRPVACGRSVSRATMSSPVERTVEICMFNGRADLFEVLDARTGAVLFASPR